MVISLVFEKIYEKLSEVKKPSVVVEASINTIASSPRIAVSQLLGSELSFKNLDTVIPFPLFVATINFSHFEPLVLGRRRLQ